MACYSSRINTSPAPAGDIPTGGCQLQPPCLQDSQAAKTTRIPSAGGRRAPTALRVAGVASLVSSIKYAHARRPLINSPPGHGSLAWGLGTRDGLGKGPRVQPADPIVSRGAVGGCARLLATVPRPLSLLGRRGLPENEPLFPGPAASSCPRRAARQTKVEPDAVGRRRLGLLPSSRSRSNPAGRQADRRMPALGEWAGTPLFLAASAFPPPSFRGPKIHGLDGQAKSL